MGRAVANAVCLGREGSGKTRCPTQSLHCDAGNGEAERGEEGREAARTGPVLKRGLKAVSRRRGT